ncbi:hypothetical protein B0T25DRAFT_554876 [Lasiosphaeria hispida]|uniref:Uncharacterized protein n=1 Tax=Lasiosphaeria hispida TaxID=260671 RepID=A0AAJ0H8A8_9PEZI|nr:hypothetical protein B0T25DRAFT_554876 [Lasiosphaeria hispida]
MDVQKKTYFDPESCALSHTLSHSFKYSLVFLALAFLFFHVLGAGRDPWSESFSSGCRGVSRKQSSIVEDVSGLEIRMSTLAQGNQWHEIAGVERTVCHLPQRLTGQTWVALLDDSRMALIQPRVGRVPEVLLERPKIGVVGRPLAMKGREDETHVKVKG